jgi:hypothetical protein
MRCVTIFAGLSLLAGAPVARADYYFEFKQFDDAGKEVEHGTWECADAETQADRCTQGVMLVIDGRPEPVEMRFKDDGGILHVTMAAGAWLLRRQTFEATKLQSKRGNRERA